MCVKRHGVLEEHRKNGRLIIHIHKKEDSSEWTNYRGISLPSLPGRVHAMMPRKQLNESWMIPSAVFVAAVAQQTEFALSRKFSRNVGSIPKLTCFVDPGKTYNRVPREELWGVMGVGRWRVPLAGLQVTVFLFRRLCECRRRLITTVQRWCWTPTMVCPVTTSFHILYQAVAYLGFHAPGDKVSLGPIIQPVRWQHRYEEWVRDKGASKADSTPKHNLAIMKNNIFKENVLIL